MSLDMMDTDELLPASVGIGLRVGDTHEERSHESRTVGHGYGIYVFHGKGGIIQCLPYHLYDSFDMLPGCDLRHHAPVLRMCLYL